jgi:hypothetical protein
MYPLRWRLKIITFDYEKRIRNAFQNQFINGLLINRTVMTFVEFNLNENLMNSIKNLNLLFVGS